MGKYEHISKARLEEYRLVADDPADAVIEAYFPDQKQALWSIINGLEDNGSKLAPEALPSLQHLYEQMQQEAKGFSVSLLQQGQAFFNAHASDIMLLLGLLSLPYCYAAANGAEVLVRSKRIVEEPERRLFETAEFVFDVSAKGAFGPKGKALPQLLKVRLMHATARWYAKRSGSWSVKEWGEPINQEDMAGTNLAFSLIVIRGLKKLAKKPSSKAALEYIVYWNCIGRLLGLHEELLPKSNKEAYLLERNIRERQFRASSAGQQLTSSLLKYFEQATHNSPIKGKSQAFVAFLLGPEVARLVGVSTSRLDIATFQPYRWFFQLQAALNRRSDSYALALKQFRKASALLKP
ncbi:oxygenase MpaB family protein [Roseivirga sp. UBA1976]|uniref:oxygenase MpaB family protein n=1 Tax=Roseivirga sp. UBA1976 TaxID=1947386 RepID=UPI00257A23B7|nr:oxygenase MpaB family protein [Roseivirga sp. UBA1976]MEC7755834.1 oxygenase MpaB family protein [Bacteroidota bacterium]|tara:strand:+ start:1438 stop:2490 length:1053 start_codon:yes stop_codon:yes gene_type:complete